MQVGVVVTPECPVTDTDGNMDSKDINHQVANKQTLTLKFSLAATISSWSILFLLSSKDIPVSGSVPGTRNPGVPVPGTQYNKC
jgi:hypothetical protein